MNSGEGAQCFMCGAEAVNKCCGLYFCYWCQIAHDNREVYREAYAGRHRATEETSG